MFNHARGLWGYTGRASDGAPLTIQATGLGAASAAIITAELCALGLRTFVRVGTARALHAGDDLAPGQVVAVTAAVAADGPSQALGARGTVRPDAALTARLVRETPVSAVVATGDLPHPDADLLMTWAHAGVRLGDLQTATVLQVAVAAKVAAAAVLVVTGAVTATPDGTALTDDDLLASVTIAAHAAAAALGLPPRDRPPSPAARDDEKAAA